MIIFLQWKDSPISILWRNNNTRCIYTHIYIYRYIRGIDIYIYKMRGIFTHPEIAKRYLPDWIEYRILFLLSNQPGSKTKVTLLIQSYNPRNRTRIGESISLRLYIRKITPRTTSEKWSMKQHIFSSKKRTCLKYGNCYPHELPYFWGYFAKDILCATLVKIASWDRQFARIAVTSWTNVSFLCQSLVECRKGMFPSRI